MASTIEIVIPVYNEEKDLPRSIEILTRFLRENLDYPWRVTIADNGSTDSTLSVGEMLSNQYPGVSCVHVPQKGRGRALRQIWTESTADIVTYMDVDLSTDLVHFPQMVKAVEEGSNIAIGSRLARGARVKRSLKREFISRCYSTMIRAMFFTPFRDAQCGFKAVDRATAQALLPLIKDGNWFFDTELLVIAARWGFRIKEIPVRWEDDPDSRVKILRTAWEDIKGLLRLRFGGIPPVPSPFQEGQENRS